MRPSLAIAAATLVCASPLEGQRLYRLEVAPAGGYHRYSSALDLKSSIGGAVRLGYWFRAPFSVELEAAFATPTTNTPLKKSVHTSTFGLWVADNFRLGTHNSFILKAGYGRIDFGRCPSVSQPGAGPCGVAGMLQGGIGTRIALSPTLLLRYDIALTRSLTTLTFSNLTLQGGVSLMLGSKPLLDGDGDGVFDRYDRCPDTRLGALVNKRGCSADQDSDGVPDGLDRCPGTTPGATVDAAGCSQDSDDDGVLDGLDACPDTPEGALVNSTGCPSDGDADGVLDGLDRCPVTPEGATVDPLGCPSDADSDGVADGLDRCANTPLGTRVNPAGCALAPAAAAEDTLAAELRWVLPGTVWQFRGLTLAPTASPVLDSVVVTLQAATTAQVEINGFAQDRLVPSDNTRLSKRRAEVVRAYLVDKGVDVRRITVFGRGSTTLILSDTTEAARIVNRRVEIRVTRNP